MDVPKKLNPFVVHGVDFHTDAGSQLVADCPLCGRAGRFYVNKKNGLWDCKKCNANGNVFGFLTQYHKSLIPKAGVKALLDLAGERKLPIRALQRRKVVRVADKEYLIPSFTEKGYVADLIHYRVGKKLMKSTKGCKKQLYGVNRLKDVSKDATIYLCEGQWDAMAMDEILYLAKVKGECVLAVPGADTFKKEWAELFKARNVIIIYDHDEAGRRGSLKVYKMLRKIAKSIQFVLWDDEDDESGYDLRDFFIACKKSSEPLATIYKRLMRKTSDKHPNAGELDKGSSPENKSFMVVPDNKRPTFNEIVELGQKCGYKMDKSFIGGMLYSFAIAASNQCADDPVWGWLVGAAGGGKSAIIAMLAKSDRICYRSRLSNKDLVSGYNQGGEDPSLLNVCNNLTVLVPDATELFSQPLPVVQETMGILRSVYSDRTYSRGYGNGVVRHYDNLHFSMLLGVTPIIYGYDSAALGERFIKYYMRPKNRINLEMERIIAAVKANERNVSREPMQDAVTKFLATDIKTWPEMPDALIESLGRLCMVVSRLRCQLIRSTSYGNSEIMVRPDAEWSPRLTLQLCKLASAIAWVKGESFVSPQTFRFVKRVAMDTCRAYNAEIVNALAKKKDWYSVTDLANELVIPRSTLDRRIDDLSHVDAVEIDRIDMEEERDALGPKKVKVVRLTKSIRTLWEESKRFFRDEREKDNDKQTAA